LSVDWRLTTNRAAGVARIADIERYVAHQSWKTRAPIDAFYGTVTAIVKAAEPVFLAQNPSIGALMLVGWVSATENYLRDVLARIIQICPCAQEQAAQQVISLGTVIWHEGIIPERGAFDHISFASADNVRQTCRRFVDYELQKNGPVDAALKEFDGVCELRHAIVHSGAIVAGKNAIKLQLRGRKGQLEVRVGFSELQEAGEICTTLVVSLNSALFEMLVERWAREWRQRRGWDPAEADRLFLDVWRMFRSETDQSQGTIPHAIGPAKCRNLVKRRFGLT
jgi:hypothetical protein